MGSELPPDTVFVSYEEVKATVGDKKVLKIFLVDHLGSKHLAAIGEDLGDAHYYYRSTKPFTKYGQLESHNRLELHIWLEMVISESGGQLQAAHLAADEQNPEGIYFVSYRLERAQYPDGRRCSRWYLMDQHNDSHLAVIGIERDTKDGHYHYTAEEPFAGIMPLHCSNQSGVYKWLEKMVTHHAGNADAPAPAASYGGGPTGSTTSGFSGGDYSAAAAGGRKPPLVINLANIRAARKSAAALHSLEQCIVVEGQPVRAKPKPKAPLAAPPLPMSTTQKHKSVGIVQQNQIKKARKLQEDLRAEEEKLQAAHLARLRRAAAAEVAGDTAAKATSLGWLHCSLSEEEGEHLEHWLGLLKAVLDMQAEQQQHAEKGGQPANQQGGSAAAAAAADAGTGKDSSSDAAAAAAAAGAAGETGDVMVWIKQPANRQHHLRVALECLKELGAQDLPARVLLTRKVIPLVLRCLSWPHKAVTSMAQHMLRRWTWQLSGHLHVMGCPTYMEDHLGALEEEVQAGMVPLPQLPKHKQALLNTPIPKLPLPNAATPAPAKFSSYSSSSHQHHAMPGSAPSMLNAGLGMQQYAGQQAGFGAGSGFAPHPMGSLTPGIGTPGAFYTPMGAAAAAAATPGMAGAAAAGTPGAGSTRGSGAMGVPGMAAAAGGMQAAAVPQPGLGGAAAAGLYGQAGAAAGYMDSATAAMFAGGWPATQGMQVMGVDGSAGSGMAAGVASGSSTDLAAMAAAAAAAAAGDQQQMALFAMQQQSQQVTAGTQMQYGQLQQQPGLTAQQQHQLTLQWQQQQQAMFWQQQQHMQAVWASGQGTSSGLAQQQQPASSQPQQQSSSQGFLQQ